MDFVNPAVWLTPKILVVLSLILMTKSIVVLINKVRLFWWLKVGACWSQNVWSCWWQKVWSCWWLNVWSCCREIKYKIQCCSCLKAVLYVILCLICIQQLCGSVFNYISIIIPLDIRHSVKVRVFLSSFTHIYCRRFG